MASSRDTDAECPTRLTSRRFAHVEPERDPWDGPSASDMRSTGVGEDLAECDSFADRQGSCNPLGASQEVSAVPSGSVDFAVLVDDDIPSSSMERIAHRKRARLQKHKRQRQKPKRTYGRYKSVPENNIKKPVEFLRPDGCPEDSIVFDQTEYNRLNYLYGPFTFDACASAFDTKCDKYCSAENPFEKADIKGHNLFINPPYDEKVLPILKHFEESRADDPYNTKALIVLPAWKESKLAQSWQPYLKNYKLIHTYPAGSYVFHTVTKDLTLEPMGPLQWDLNVYLADSSVEERLCQAFDAAYAVEILQAAVTEQPEVINPKVYKPHQPRFETEKAYVSTASDNDLLMLYPKLKDKSNIKFSLMLDSGASKCFIDDSYVRNNKLTREPLEKKLRIILADGSQVIASHSCTLPVRFDDHEIMIKFVVTKLQSQFDAVLGMDFLREHNPQIDWTTSSITFGNNRVFNGEQATRPAADVQIVHANSMARLMKKNKNLTYFCAILRQYDATTEKFDNESLNDEINSIETDQSKAYTEQLRNILRKHKSVCIPLESLPVHRPGLDHTIELTSDFEYQNPKLYRLSQPELEELQKQLETFLRKGWIKESFSPFCSPVLFARKANGGLRLCIDYRHLNKYTKKVNYPLPNVDMLLDTLSGARVYTALDCSQGFHQLRIDPDSQEKTSFITQYGQWQWTVLPMGLSSAPSSFQRLLNTVLKPHVNTFVLIYLDDILIFSDSLDEHLQHIEIVLKLLEENNLSLRLPKCFWAKDEMEYLGHMVSQAGLRPTQSKVKTISEWPTPASVQNVQQFLGFCNFYRRYIRNYSHIAAPLYQLTKKDKTDFTWSDEHHSAFVHLKNVLISAPLLHTPKCGPDAEFVISTDASKFAAGAILLQADENGDLHPCAYYSKVFQANQTHYPSYQQELLGIVLALQEWRPYLEGSKKITCITDHATLRHLTETENVTALAQRRFALWSDIMSPYISVNADGSKSFEILYRKGEDNDSDALSRRPDLHFSVTKYTDMVNENDLELANEFFSSMCHLQIDDKVTQKIIGSYPQDPMYNGLTLPRGMTFNAHSGLYYMADKVCIPKDASLRLLLIQEYHDAQGHPSLERTVANLSKSFWWPNLHKSVKQYCRSCDTCHRVKNRTTKVPGSLSPLPKPKKPWDVTSMDFITGLPMVDGYDAIATFVDCFTKQAHFIPCSSKINAEQFARLYFSEIFRLHGLSRCIISDRDPLFTSVFWKDLMRQLKTKLNMSTAYHPQTDGQTERTHRTIEQILRAFIYKHHADWLHTLPLAEFCYNNSVHSAIKFSPFEALYGFSPLTPPDLLVDSPKPFDCVQRIHDIHALITEELKISDAYMKHDAARRADARIEFEEGDNVWLSTDHLLLHDQPSRKFRQRFIGPYPVVNKISSQAYELRLPPTMKCHNVFHISRLRPYEPSADTVPDFIPTSIEKPRAEFIVDHVVNHAIVVESDGFYRKGPALVFLIRWAGYGSADDTWQTYETVRRVQALDTYARNNTSFRQLLKTPRYRKLHQRYPARFPLFDL